MRWLVAMFLRTEGIVDQIDGGIAAVELRDLEVVYVPVESLPSGVREGDRVRLRGMRPVEDPAQYAGNARRRRRDVP